MKQSITGKESSVLCASKDRAKQPKLITRDKDRAKQPKLITRDKTNMNFMVPLYFQMQRLPSTNNSNPATTIIKKNIPDIQDEHKRKTKLYSNNFNKMTRIRPFNEFRILHNQTTVN